MDLSMQNTAYLGKIMSICNKQHLTIFKGKSCVSLNSVQQWLLGYFCPSYVIHMATSYVCIMYLVLYIPLSRIKEYRCLKNVIRQINSKN